MQIIDTIDYEHSKHTLDGYIEVTGGLYVSEKHFQGRPIHTARLYGKMYNWMEGALALEGNFGFPEIRCSFKHYFVFYILSVDI